ncbi:kynureninase [Calycina marina]|uniref:Kynureninase n=1 Tax=Calycina marina TaxID=1763456 RepID=A0A9P8CFM3_9HELO|nr:kynureninase [Calycina marina]
MSNLHVDVFSMEHAAALDAACPLRHLREQFLIPTKADLTTTAFLELEAERQQSDDESSSIYLCGNSLGLQPRLTSVRLQQYLTTWQTQGVYGHFKPLNQSPLPVWLHADEEAARRIAPIVGAPVSEVAVMETLTANLHFLIAAFYRPDISGRHKIILESKAFPSDHYVVESQIYHHNLSPATSMITIDPATSSEAIISTAHILAIIAEHASTTALLLLPGIQFYSGQLLNIPTITAAARKAGIFVIWDLAHAVGNVPLQLHDWNVDAAAWCSYKYLNAGPGAIGGLFIHERNGGVSPTPESGDRGFTNRLSGWWGSDKSTRFTMDNKFVPIPGAAGFQLSNPSILDITSLNASLQVFEMAGGMVPLREKSLRLTEFLETGLDGLDGKPFRIITPREKGGRGAQLSLRLEDGLLDDVMKRLVELGVVVDERRPDVVRVAPAPLYNSYTDVWRFVNAFEDALDFAVERTRKS